MKRWISLLLVVVLVMSLSGCGGAEMDTSTGSGSTASQNGQTASRPESSDRSRPSHSSESTDSAESNHFSTSQSSQSTASNSTSPTSSMQSGTVTTTSNNQPSGSQNTSAGTSQPETPAGHTHLYQKQVVSATCNAGGYIEHRCACGNHYQSDRTGPTYRHTFRQQPEYNGIHRPDLLMCTKCGLIAWEHGNADGSMMGGNDQVKYYVTGTITAKNGVLNFTDLHIVIYGTGAMPDFSSKNLPMWHYDLYAAKKITIADGITSLGEYAFYCPDGNSRITIEMADSVTKIKRNAIYLNMTSLSLGSGVTWVDAFGIRTQKHMTGIYLPRSLKYFGPIGHSWAGDTAIFYAGSKQEFLSLTTTLYNQSATLKDVLDFYFSGDVYSPYFHAYMNAKQLGDRHDYFDMMREWKR